MLDHMQVCGTRNLRVMADGTDLVTIDAAAAMLGVSEQTIYRWVNWGWLESRSAIHPASGKRRTAFDRESVEKLAAERAAGILREAPRPQPKPPAS